ncbi:CHASE3 domain-containing protein [Duganella violaceipulchra]|uniref:CHASE3 domain-containing protein n=1 Tax=Duganella violaceipulchra TaxID=2849652 RepID=A0AA41L3F0_9BURK|nr:CHASE3 domain-containing protein [Duganella violaceicalia]MBV6319647.1 CHASE3 domain-containing protein [Duganella violaceicalia]MCP2006541.1 signal transduction histidine kinase [Duganella violaceicalia]
MYFTVETAPHHRLPLYKTVLCVTCALLLIVNGFSLFHNLQALRGAQVQLGQTARVADRLQYLNVLVLDAESSMRGYFLSGRDAYLGPTRTALAETEIEFKELDKLLADSPSQLKNLAQLHTLVRRRLSIMSQAIDVYREGGLEEIVKIAKLSDGRASMDEIRLQVVIMEQEQNETLVTRSATFYQEYQKAVLLGMGINALAIVVLIMFYQLVRRSFANRAQVEHALQSANENLESQVEQRTEQLSVLSRHLISISEEEKVRLSRELHDELGANLTSIAMDIAAVTQQLQKTDPELAAQLKRARATLVETVEMKRRIVENLRPSLLDNLGLCAAIESYCNEFSRLAKVRCDCDVDADIEGAASQSGDLSIALFRIVQESLTNIRKYAKASRVTVTMSLSPGGLTLRIIDDGIGIASNTIVKPMSHGLLGMRERALLLGGALTIRRGRNDAGTCIEVSIPLRNRATNEERRADDGPATPMATLPPAISEVLNSVLHPPADGRIPSSPPCSTHPHTPPSLSDQAQ